MNEVKNGEIVFANLIFRNKKGQKFKVKSQIFSKNYDGTYQSVYTKDKDGLKLKLFAIKEDSITLIDVEIIKSLGFKNNPNDFIQAYK